MTWRVTRDDDSKTYYAIWEEEYPGHHRFALKFNLNELKEQLNLVSKQ